MQAHLAHARRLGGAQQGVNMVFVAVHAAVGQQPQHMQAMACARAGKGIGNHRVAGKCTLFDIQINPADVLLHHPACADVQMTHFGIAKLPARQAHGVFGGIQHAVRVTGAQGIPVGGMGMEDGVVVAIFAMAKTVKNQQQHRSNRIHGHRQSGSGSDKDCGIVPVFQGGACLSAPGKMVKNGKIRPAVRVNWPGGGAVAGR